MPSKRNTNTYTWYEMESHTVGVTEYWDETRKLNQRQIFTVNLANWKKSISRRYRRILARKMGRHTIAVSRRFPEICTKTGDTLMRLQFFSYLCLLPDLWFLRFLSIGNVNEILNPEVIFRTLGSLNIQTFFFLSFFSFSRKVTSPDGLEAMKMANT